MRREETLKDISEETLRRFLGETPGFILNSQSGLQKMDYYLTEWRLIEQANTKLSWNWAAFVTSILWFGYRKMFRYVWLISFVYVIELPVLMSFQIGRLLEFAITTITSIIIATFANHLYYGHAKLKILRIKSREYSEQEEKIKIAEAGGTSSWGVIGAIMIVAFMILVSALMFLAIFGEPPPE